MEKFGKINLTVHQLKTLKTPCYIVNETSIEDNLKILDHVQKQTGCKILLALKGFAMWNMAPLISKYLYGVTASSLNEALLGKEEFRKEVHLYAPAYKDEEFDQLLSITDHISFNSISQIEHFRKKIEKCHSSHKFALRINPEHSEVSTKLYDPCAPFSRLGTTLKNFTGYEESLEGISGLHFHTLCELNSDALERTLKEVENKFSYFFDRITWINFGGGHHISRPDYDVDRLIRIINDFREKYKLEVYLEPGEAIAINTGVLVASVLDLFKNDKDIAILDTSVTTHMPDVLEMPYRPEILNAGVPGEKSYTYRLGGVSCLAGDVVGDYSFDKPLEIGQKLIFGDMSHYTMVKNTTFNGVNLPAIYKYNSNSGELTLVKEFGYEDFKGRLS
ncbi:MAG: carboxynorspermidine decarboxylase [Bacteroidales bacterium]|nr:carboxynorspermidine decarboxylase [Bacteroidales bacterium]